MNLHTYLAAASVDMAGLADYLDHLDAPARLREVRSLVKREQVKLFEAAAGARSIHLAHFVPAGIPPLREVIHYGRNSLPAFHTFEKRFCLPDTGGDELWGYNEHALRALTGPGYFVVREPSHAERAEMVIDYTELPPSKPEAWPPIRPNSARLGRFIYHQTRDIVRAVSQHVTVGRDTRNGQPLDAWFVLCRSDG
jgi:hypothetical protein